MEAVKTFVTTPMVHSYASAPTSVGLSLVDYTALVCIVSRLEYVPEVIILVWQTLMSVQLTTMTVTLRSLKCATTLKEAMSVSVKMDTTISPVYVKVGSSKDTSHNNHRYLLHRY